MPQLTPYATAEMLRAVLGPATYMAIYDDEQTGDVEFVDRADAVKFTLRRAHARVVSRLPPIYRTLPTTSIADDIPALLQDAELLYACGLSYDRHPEYARVYGRPKFVEADEIMDNVQAAILMIADNPPEPSPANVGGTVTSKGPRAFVDVNGNYTGGDF